MAKTVKQRQDPTANPRSRAAKRATSPSINVDKSIRDAPRAYGTSPMLGINHTSGVSKKKKAKQMTRGQRMRQEKGLARAEVVMDQMEKKVGGAKAKLKTRQGRKSAWEDINSAALEEQRKMPKPSERANATGNVQDLTDGHNEGDVEMISTTNDATDKTVVQNGAQNHPQTTDDSNPSIPNAQGTKDESELIT